MITILNGKLIDPRAGTIIKSDIQIKDGLIYKIEEQLEPKGQVIEGEGLYISPGFVDSHVHFRTPGMTEAEDLSSGSMAAAHGGFTSVICMANTVPVIDNPKRVREFYDMAKDMPINLYTVGAFTVGQQNKELADIKGMKEAGAVGISDDGIPNMDTGLIYRGLLMAKEVDLPVSFHDEDPNLIDNPGINKGEISEELGLGGAPALAEDLYVAREGMMALETGAKIVVQHMSSGRAVDLLRFYQSLGAHIYGEVTPHHFSSTEELVRTKGTLAKMNPPLRTDWDRGKLITGLKDKTIGIIATDHAPHLKENKDKDFVDAPSGIIGLETAFSLAVQNLIKPGHMDLVDVIKSITTTPGDLYKIDTDIKIGKTANLTVFDLDEKWIYNRGYSKSTNSPYLGEKMTGKIKYTIGKGKLIYRDGGIDEN